MRLADVIGRWIGKVEIVLAGADEDLREGQDALTAGDPMRARAAAHRVLTRAPHSPLGLALLADACDAGHLGAELAMTLEELAERAPSRAEVWVRLGRARRATAATPDEVRDAFVRALGVAEAGSEGRRDALLALADLDLAQGDAGRAELWLERAADDRSPEIAQRRAEARLLAGDPAAAKSILDGVTLDPADGRGALVQGQALAMLADPRAFTTLVRAMVLDVPGASEALSSALARLPSDAQLRARLRSVVDAKGEQDLARWRAAFARAEGAPDTARRALRDAVEAGDAAAARLLLDAALDDRDAEALAVAVHALPEGDPDPVVADARLLAVGTLDALERVTHPRVIPFAEARSLDVARSWLGGAAGADWPRILGRLDTHARALSDLDGVTAIADLAAEQSRPVRLAIVGEFNAGKSTFINALMGADVAPTGVLPTTATLHHLRWAPDPIARIFFAAPHDPPERIVPLGELRTTLKSLDPPTLRRVELLLPLAFLVRVEILDTPGFNAPDARHEAVAQTAFEEADAAIWLLDATQAMKQSEREVLEQARKAKLPIQILVNKADRLGAADLARVMAAVDEALTTTGIVSWARPLALSAKRALAGRLGDPRALEESGWEAVQALLEERIVARAPELKQRALVRRAAAIVARLSSQAEGQAREQRAREEARSERARALGHAAASIERASDEIAERLATSLEPAAQGWRQDVSLVYVGRDRESVEHDRQLARYRVERALVALAPPLSHALASLAADPALGAAHFAATARTLVRAASAPPRASEADPEALLLPLAHAAVATLVEQLFALSVAPPPVTQTEGLVRELRAFATALG